MILSDGSSYLNYYDENFLFIKKVRINGISNINELEFVNGLVYANVWYDNFIYIVNPSSGNIIGKMDFTDLKIENKADVLNGIAYNSQNNRFLISGKLWSNVYEVEISEILNCS